jgi:signal transduction histidine kinase
MSADMSIGARVFRACLFTNDEYVITAVQRVIPGVQLERDPGRAPAQADLYMWDLNLGTALPAALTEPSAEQQLILIVSQTKLETIPEHILAGACVLLTPINPFTLRTFIDLAARASQLREQMSQVDRLHSEREALIQYVLAANLKLQQYDQQRTEFLARALHDFRAPLIAVYGYCGLLADGQLGPVSSRQEELLRRMQASTKRVSRQADGMLELSLSGHVKRCPQRVPGDIEDTIAQAVNEVLPLALEKDIDLNVGVYPAETEFLFEPDQIAQLLVNLLENCCKFAPVGGVIKVRGYSIGWDFRSEHASGRWTLPGAEHNAYRIDVEDNGPGIQPHLLSSIFEQYVSHADGRHRSGGGLGLAICKMIASAHGGCIWATNAERGAVFSVVLPLHTAPLAASVKERQASYLPVHDTR